MNGNIGKGSWVDVKVTILSAGRRAEQVPQDTAETDLVMKVKGTLVSDAEIGGQCTIETPIGRRITGTLLEANPAYLHNYGAPIPELLPIGRELRTILAERRAT